MYAAHADTFSITVLFSFKIISTKPSVAESLTHVLEQMTQANENLNGLEHGTEQVEQIADLWKSAYRKSDDQQEHSSRHRSGGEEQSTSGRTSLSVLRGDDMDMEY